MGVVPEHFWRCSGKARFPAHHAGFRLRATAGRHIAALESALGQVLFTRSQTGLLATETALALRVHAEAMESTANTLARTASNFSHNSASIHGVVRVSASDVIGVEVLPPLIARLRESHPQITIELVLSNRVQDLLHGSRNCCTHDDASTGTAYCASSWPH